MTSQHKLLIAVAEFHMQTPHIPRSKASSSRQNPQHCSVTISTYICKRKITIDIQQSLYIFSACARCQLYNVYMCATQLNFKYRIYRFCLSIIFAFWQGFASIFSFRFVFAFICISIFIIMIIVKHRIYPIPISVWRLSHISRRSGSHRIASYIKLQHTAYHRRDECGSKFSWLKYTLERTKRWIEYSA